MRSTVWVGAGALAFATAGVLGLAGPAVAATDYPAPDGRCVDRVGVLGDDLCARVTRILLREEKATSDEIAVAVVPTTGGATIERWGTGLFNAWGVGKSVKNNGVLLVVAVDDHRVRLVTGRGMAKRLPDAAASKIISTAITPLFAQDRYAAGILDGLDQVRSRIGHRIAAGARLTALATEAPATAEKPAVEEPEDEDVILAEPPGLDFSDEVPFPRGVGDESLPPIWPVMLVVLVLGGLVTLVRRTRGSESADGDDRDDDRRRWSSANTSFANTSSTNTSSAPSWPSGSSSSGGSSSSSDFGGGSSSGSGASGSW